MLKNLIKLKETIELAPYNIDYFITDNAPGLGFITLNSMLITDNSHFIVKFSNSELLGNMAMAENKYELIKNRIVKTIERRIVDIKIHENIKFNTNDTKVGGITEGEMEAYFVEITNDPKLKRFLD